MIENILATEKGENNSNLNYLYMDLYEKGSAFEPLTNYKNLSDEELVTVFIDETDEEAFNEIVNRYSNKIFGLALRITRNYADAEEVVQKVFISLIEKLETFREDSKFSTWLYRVATNVSLMHLRIERRKHANHQNFMDYVNWNESGVLEGVKSKDWSYRADKLLESQEAIEQIERAVNELPEAYRIVFHLSDIEGLSNDEVAEVLKISRPAVKSRIHRARLFLRDKLTNYLFG